MAEIAAPRSQHLTDESQFERRLVKALRKLTDLAGVKNQTVLVRIIVHRRSLLRHIEVFHFLYLWPLPLADGQRS